MSTLAERLAAKKAALAVVPVSQPVAVQAPVTIEPSGSVNPVDVVSFAPMEQATSYGIDEEMTGLLEGVDSIDALLQQSAAIAVDEIVPKIRALDALSVHDAELEMAKLKAALLANPTAVSLMLPEDIGLLSRTLKRIEGMAVSVNATKSPATASKSVNAKIKDIEAALKAGKPIETADDF